jgi:hypothetical protein
MYATTPAHRAATTPSSRRSTRAARVSSKRRSRGSHKAAASSSTAKKQQRGGPAQKWVQVMRPPAPHITFEIATWVPLTDLTEDERDEHLKQQQQEETEVSRPPTPRGDSNVNTSSPKSMDLSTPGHEASRLDTSGDATTATPCIEAAPLQPASTDEQPPTKKIRITDTPAAAQDDAAATQALMALAGEPVGVDNTNLQTNPPQQTPPISPPLKKRRLYDDSIAPEPSGMDASLTNVAAPTEQPLASETEAVTETATTSAEQVN